MKKLALTIAATAGCAALLISGSAMAQGKSTCSPGKNKGPLVDFYGATPEEVGSPTPAGHVTTLGGALSGGFYGNTSNSGDNVEDAPTRGHGVTPSISPGPQVVDGGGPGTGTSIGGFIQESCPPS